MILVSACLLGQSTRYDGGHTFCPELMDILKGKPYLALCPEILGGLPVPRTPADIQGGRPGKEGSDVLEGRAKVLAKNGGDVTAHFLHGAELALNIALKAGVTHCYLKDRSPSCAWDPKGANPGGGPGQGVFAALARRHGLVITEIQAINPAL